MRPSCIVWKCRIGWVEFERFDRRNVGGGRGCERCWQSRLRDDVDVYYYLDVMVMIGGIDDDCEAMAGGAVGSIA